MPVKFRSTIRAHQSGRLVIHAINHRGGEYRRDCERSSKATPADCVSASGGHRHGYRRQRNAGKDVERDDFAVEPALRQPEKRAPGFGWLTALRNNG